MGSSVFNIGVSGLNAANLGLTVTGHNISNANTDGYSRQTIQQSAPYPLQSGSGFIGMGVQVDSIRRVFDQFLTRQLQTAQTQNSYLDTYSTHLSGIDNTLADPTAGLAPALQSFFSTVQDVATHPADIPSRQSLISGGQTLLTRLQSFNTQLTEQSSTLNGEISSTVGTINTLSSQIANLNQQIAAVNGTGQPPNDLLDQRDNLVKELNKYVKATTISQGDGSINVFIGNGQNLVVGASQFTLAAVPSPSDPQQTTVAYQQNGNTIFLPESSLSGGQLQGLFDFRNNALIPATNTLNQVALTVAQTVNDQQRAGQDLNNNIGLNFFDFNRSGTQNVTLSGATVNFTAAGTTIPSSDFSIAYDSVSTNYTLTRLSDNQAQTITTAQMTAGFTALGVTVKNAGAAPAASATTGMSFPPAVGNINFNTKNTGTAQLSGYISDVNQLTASNYDLGFDGANYTVTRLSDGQKTTYASLPLTQDGFTISQTSGVMNAGDHFTIQPTAGFIRSLSVRMTDPREVAAAAPVSSKTPTTNTGTLTATQPQTAALTTLTTDSAINPAIKTPVQIKFTSANTFDVLDVTNPLAPVTLSAGNAYVAGMTVSQNGWSTKLDGQPKTGDVVNISQNTGGASDNRNALAMAALQTTKLMGGSTATYQNTYDSLVSKIGTLTNQATVSFKAQAVVLQQAQTQRDSSSGVNLDEEAANLLRYQQAYQASSKVIQIANQAFQAIANIV
ncbi:flagellar hook-associated protein FlgK [Andreprevotia chitinilytica]|uniref:flagellar hook-associated protein FlgK n=1 Tax=Andreprevotia chitinilytica TaxID=396808 RepID=UPI00054E11EE|nr:flagellar hook-associated protein FlgK [Andreprevotia chitinilytica]